MALISPFFLDEPKLYRSISHMHKTESKRWNTRREHFKSDLLFFRGFRRFYTNIGGSASRTLEPPRSPPSTYRKSTMGLLTINQITWLTAAFPHKSQEFSTEIEHPYVTSPRRSQCRGTETLCGTV